LNFRLEYTQYNSTLKILYEIGSRTIESPIVWFHFTFQSFKCKIDGSFSEVTIVTIWGVSNAITFYYIGTKINECILVNNLL